jgi:putative flippase GtrA
MGTVLQLAVLAALEGILRIHYLAATALAVETAVVHNFLWHDRWTWADREGESGSPSRFLKFHGTTGLVSILGNLAFMRLFVGELSLHPVAGNIASIACCAAVNFVLNDRVVFVTQSRDVS